MPLTSPKVLASVGYWQRLGLTAAEVAERIGNQYPSLSDSDIFDAMALSNSMAVAGSAVQSSPGNLPLLYLQLPQVQGQETQYEYRMLVPLYDPNSDTTENVLVIRRSNAPLTYSELETFALGEAGQTVEQSPEKFMTEDDSRFQVDLLTQNAVQVVSASTWTQPTFYAAFGS